MSSVKPLYCSANSVTKRLHLESGNATLILSGLRATCAGLKQFGAGLTINSQS